MQLFGKYESNIDKSGSSDIWSDVNMGFCPMLIQNI